MVLIYHDLPVALILPIGSILIVPSHHTDLLGLLGNHATFTKRFNDPIERFGMQSLERGQGRQPLQVDE